MAKQKRSLLFIGIAVSVGTLAILGVAFYVLNEGFAEHITITNKYKTYSAYSDLVLRGKTKIGSDVIVFFGEGIGLASVDALGNWKVNVGKVSAGSYSLQVLAQSDDSSDSVATAQINVNENVSVINNWLQYLPASVSFADEPASNMIPKDSPKVLQGEWKLLQ